MSTANRRLGQDRGAVTVEAALSLTALIAVVVFCLGAVAAGAMQVRCIDAAREVARLAARGDTARAEQAGAQVAPAGARISVRTDGDRVRAVVSAGVPLLPLLELSAEAVAVLEPAGGGGE